ncbi:DUF6440 family protein [Bacillus sp. M6-12]|uniref:DUF6440 family protein n=1 Tax=Bacillus sp. M6-12 TaxID=2054166 RepID=UPI0015E1025F|nr:DUF6440 family protein [Bacillus sp. M6-12]
MKKVISIIAVSLFSVLLLSGCDNPFESTTSDTGSKVESVATTNDSKEEKVVKQVRFLEAQLDKYTFILIDKKTKVQYMKVVRNVNFDGGVDITPLYQKDGKPFVGEEVKANRFTTEQLDGYTFILTDTETGVQYLKVTRNKNFDGGVSITPMLNAEGGLLTNEQ